MFKKVSNIDLKNKIDYLDNKLDIVMNFLSSTNTITGCCDCQARETKIYNDLKNFLETKMEGIKTDIESKLEQSNSSTFVGLFEEHKHEIIYNLEIIIQHLKDINTNAPAHTINDIYKLLLSHTSAINSLDNRVSATFDVAKELSNGMAILHYENEVIKHQLLLEDEIRKYDNEIDSLKLKVNESLSEVNDLISIITNNKKLKS